MDIRLWCVIGIMAMVIGGLLLKLHSVHKATKEITHAFAEHLTTDTNTLIDVNSSDVYVKKLAAQINVSLRTLREQRHKYVQGDAELKSAVTNISHDLRTPLTAIQGYLDLLSELDLGEEGNHYVDMIKNRTEHMTELTEELFRYSILLSEGKELAKEPVVINAVLEESVAGFYAVLTEKGIEPQIHMPQEKVVRYLDASALSRVFSNLLNNALKYSDGDLEIELTKEGRITFSNTAKDLDEVQVGKLFDRFYTVVMSRRSTGLGLAIAKNLVEQMGGSIRASYLDDRLYVELQFEGRYP